MKRSLKILVSFFCLCLGSGYCGEIRNSNYFEFSCSSKDENFMRSKLEELETFYADAAKQLELSDANRIMVVVYPDIHTFHEEMGLKDAPRWAVGSAEKDKVHVVSPLNPGDYHTDSTIYKVLKIEIASAMVSQKYGEDNLPSWLKYGVASYLANNPRYLPEGSYIPTLDQLEEDDIQKCEKLRIFEVANVFVAHVINTYGWEKLKGLLEQYEANKQELYQDWVQTRQVKQ